MGEPERGNRRQKGMNRIDLYRMDIYLWKNTHGIEVCHYSGSHEAEGLNAPAGQRLLKQQK